MAGDIRLFDGRSMGEPVKILYAGRSVTGAKARTSASARSGLGSPLRRRVSLSSIFIWPVDANEYRMEVSWLMRSGSLGIVISSRSKSSRRWSKSSARRFVNLLRFCPIR